MWTLFKKRETETPEKPSIVQEMDATRERNNWLTRETEMLGRIRELERSRRDLATELQSKNDELTLIADKLEAAKSESLKARRPERGYDLIEAFILAAPYLEDIVGRPFVMSASREFDYRADPDSEYLEAWREEERRRMKSEYVDFRDVYRKGFGIRSVFCHISRGKEYFMTTERGKISMRDFIMPPGLRSGGVEIASNARTAMFETLRTGKSRSSVIPAHVLGAPLLSFAFPVFDDKNLLIGGISFGVEIINLLSTVRELNRVISKSDDSRLSLLANTLKNELAAAGRSATEVRKDAILSKTAADRIRQRGGAVLDIAEQLEVLAINTAIEASKAGNSGRGVGVIAAKMREISASTHRTLQEITTESEQLDRAADRVIEQSQVLNAGSSRLTEESEMLFDASRSLAEQKLQMAGLVKASIQDVAVNQENMNAIGALLEADQ